MRKARLGSAWEAPYAISAADEAGPLPVYFGLYLFSRIDRGPGPAAELGSPRIAPLRHLHLPGRIGNPAHWSSKAMYS